MASAALIGGALAAVGSVGASVMSNKSNSSIEIGRASCRERVSNFV